MNAQPPSQLTLDPDTLVTALKAVAEPTRLRILLLLKAGELNVKDLTQVLGQSQPRLSRHLKLLSEAGLIERVPEGSWVYFHVTDRTREGRLAGVLANMADPTNEVLARDQRRALDLKRAREAGAQRYFDEHAADWDRIRALHVPEQEVEAAVLDLLGAGPFETFVDLGTGTGRILELFADRYRYGVGFDMNQAMLAYARSKLAAAGLAHAHLRHADLYNLPLPSAEADAVVMHQVLHFLAEPQAALGEAARVLKPGGRLLIVDFLPHTIEFLRDAHAHERLGFAPEAIAAWAIENGLRITQTRVLRAADDASSMRDDQLTVSLWLAERMGRVERASHAQPSSEIGTLMEMK